MSHHTTERTNIGDNITVRLPERKFGMNVTRERLRGFMSQYVIARAPSFSKDKEEADAWECMLRARTIFHALDKVADAEPEDPPPIQQAAGNLVGQAMQSMRRFDPPTYPDPRRAPHILTEEEAYMKYPGSGTLAKLYNATVGRVGNVTKK